MGAFIRAVNKGDMVRLAHDQAFGFGVPGKEHVTVLVGGLRGAGVGHGGVRHRHVILIHDPERQQVFARKVQKRNYAHGRGVMPQISAVMHKVAPPVYRWVIIDVRRVSLVQRGSRHKGRRALKADAEQRAAGNERAVADHARAGIQVHARKGGVAPERVLADARYRLGDRDRFQGAALERAFADIGKPLGQSRGGKGRAARKGVVPNAFHHGTEGGEGHVFAAVKGVTSNVRYLLSHVNARDPVALIGPRGVIRVKVIHRPRARDHQRSAGGDPPAHVLAAYARRRVNKGVRNIVVNAVTVDVALFVKHLHRYAAAVFEYIRTDVLQCLRYRHLGKCRAAGKCGAAQNMQIRGQNDL